MDPLTLIIVVLLVLWLGGLGFSVGGSAVHLLLVLLVVIVLVRLLQGRSL